MSKHFHYTYKTLPSLQTDFLACNFLRIFTTKDHVLLVYLLDCAMIVKVYHIKNIF
jgi:hypothetical protein